MPSMTRTSTVAVMVSGCMNGVMPLLLAYLPPDEATARWDRINADGSRVVIVVRPARVAGRQQVR
jgi:hypothetical protein